MGDKGRSGPFYLIVLCVRCVHAWACVRPCVMLSCGGGRLHHDHKPVRCLDAAWNTWASRHVPPARTQDIKEVCLDSAAASPTPSAMRQDEHLAVWKDMAADEVLFHGPWSVG